MDETLPRARGKQGSSEQCRCLVTHALFDWKRRQALYKELRRGRFPRYWSSRGQRPLQASSKRLAIGSSFSLLVATKRYMSRHFISRYFYDHGTGLRSRHKGENVELECNVTSLVHVDGSCSACPRRGWTEQAAACFTVTFASNPASTSYQLWPTNDVTSPAASGCYRILVLPDGMLHHKPTLLPLPVACAAARRLARSSRTVRCFSSGLAFDKGPMQFGVPVVRARGASGTTRSKTRTAACRAVLPGGLLKEVNHGRR